MRILTTTLSLAVIAFCSIKIITASQSDISNTSSKYPAIAQDVNKGKEVYNNNCLSCHKLEDLTVYSEKQWKEVVPKMVKKVNDKAGEIAIDEKSEELLLKFLLTNKPIDKIVR